MNISRSIYGLFRRFRKPDNGLDMESGRKTNQFVPREPCKWTEYIHLRRTGHEENVPRFDKIQVARKVSECGLRSAEIYHVFDDPRDFDDVGLPDIFVLKPTSLWSMHGVMLLRRHKNKRKFLDLFGKRWLTIDQIRAKQCELQCIWFKHKNTPFRLNAQEMVSGENGQGKLPYDYKLYTFDGDVRLIMQVNRNTRPPAVTWFLNEFEIFDYSTCIESKWKTIKPSRPCLPKCHKEIVAAAKTISKALKTPFISVDTYATPDGPVIGELTATPGGPYYGMFTFKTDFDKVLGEAWTDANIRLGRQIPVLNAEIPEVRIPASKVFFK